MSKQYYDHIAVETKWQAAWEKARLFLGSSKKGQSLAEKQYLLFAFAYPSGSGLHVGHVESKTALDIIARYERMHGKDVFFPVGWDAFGLPAENYAIKTGVHPVETTKNAITTFRRQIKRLGISYDWDNEIATNHPEYYKWTQWIFLQLLSKGLAYQKKAPVNWCPSCQTVLANEQVVAGLCERCDSEVIQKEMKQWFFKITQYQDELISGLDTVDWPEPTKQQQLFWIGKKSGVVIKFAIPQLSSTVECFTTRVDTIFGVSFVAISPELARVWMKEGWNAPAQVVEYCEQAAHKTEEDRRRGEKKKTGANTGLLAQNPATGTTVPIFVADYVLAEYGTGAVMGVPAHDQRDFECAALFGVKVLPVIQAASEKAKESTESTLPMTEPGVLVNSATFTGMSSKEAQEKIPAAFTEHMEVTNRYKLRDWLISRQRYWGTPIPVVYDPEGTPHPVKEEHLPWELPTDVDFKPTGESPLKSSKEFIERTERLYGAGWRPEFDTMDTFVDSSWYFMRYTDARNPTELADAAQLRKWLPVDLYMIGPEHIVLHLLYSRFFTKFLRDQGLVDADEPFAKMRHQGMILGPDGKKMSKSKGNVINPDEVIEKFGADTLRVYEMFMGPLEADKPWDPRAVIGVYKFLQRIHVLATTQKGDGRSEHEALTRVLHQTLKKVTADIPNRKFNTAIAELMKCSNAWEQAQKEGADLTAQQKDSFVRMIAPFAPFLAEELYQTLSNPEEGTFVHQASWPAHDENLAQAETIIIPVQVNGKVRAQLEVSIEESESKDALMAQARALGNIEKYFVGKKVVKEIYIPGKIISFVVV